jgi:carbon starvation protein CstA
VWLWLKKKGKHNWFVVIPMVFMLVMTLWALFLIILQYKLSLIGFIGAILLFLAIMLIYEAIEIFEVKKHAKGILRKKKS